MTRDLSQLTRASRNRLQLDEPRPAARVLFVGLQNPLSGGHENDLLPLPEESSGGRLCRLLDLDPDYYVTWFARRNLYVRGEKITARESRLRVKEVLAWADEAWPTDRRDLPIIGLGRQVAQAFMYRLNRVAHDGPPRALPYRWFGTYLFLPHPSGRNRLWSASLAEHCRVMFRGLLEDCGRVLP